MPVDTQAGASPLLDRIRESVIGDDQVMHGPVRPAPGHLRRLHRLGPGADVHRGLHPRRGAAALRQHPHRVARHRAADHPAPRGRPRGSSATRSAATTRPCVIFCGSGATGAIDKLIGILGLRIPADLDDRYGLSAQHPGRASGRSCSSGRSSTTPTSCRGASRSPTSSTIPEDADGHIDLARLEQRAGRATPTGR